jgi:glycolate oxidase
MCCVKYGVTTEYVLGLEVVLASGEVLRTGRRTAKGVAGYDLTRLFVGSEGTLGVITEVTLSLRPAPEESLTLVAVFPSTTAAGTAVAGIAARGLSPSLLELLDRTHLQAVEAYQPMGLRTDAEALLLAAVDTGSRAADDLARLAEVCEAAGADEVFAATDAVEAAALLQARRLAHPAMEKFAADAPGQERRLVIDDGPCRRVAGRLLDGGRIAKELSVPICIGHAGGGNMRPTSWSTGPTGERGPRRCASTKSCGWTGLAPAPASTGSGCQGDWLARRSTGGVRVHRAIKAALDPDGLLSRAQVCGPDLAHRTPCRAAGWPGDPEEFNDDLSRGRLDRCAGSGGDQGSPRPGSPGW